MHLAATGTIRTHCHLNTPGATTVVRPDKPIMGNIVTLSKDDWSAWTGGKPASGWMCLDATASDELTSPNQL